MTPRKINIINKGTQVGWTGVSRMLCVSTLVFIMSACGGGSGGSGGSSSTAPSPPPVPPSASDQQIFEATLRPLLVDPANNCVICHGDTIKQDPTFAVADATAAYNILRSQQKVNLTNPELSRIYVRPKDTRHNCGGAASCDRIAADFLAAIQDWETQATAAAPPPGDNTRLVSAMTTFAMATNGGALRADGNAIALFTFSEGAGNVTMDTSGVGSPITLQIEGMEWVDGGGLRNVSGKAEASLTDSRKLFNSIVPENEYSVEAWVTPNNTAQDGPARIVSYSLGTQQRNFTMGQDQTSYQLRNHSVSTNANGSPGLDALDPQVDTVLQHVVMTFDGASGRKVFVNGQLSVEENIADVLDWQDDHLLVLGNEVSNNRLWQGVFKFVAVHNKALTAAEVQQNYNAGVGGSITMRFDVSSVIGQTAYIDMLATQLDPSGYVFARPMFVSDATGVAVKNIRVGVNGAVPVAAQPFRRIDMVVNQSGTELSPLGALIPVSLGRDDDQFHLEFEVLGDQFGFAEPVVPSSPPGPVADVPEPDLGVRTFSQINDTMSSLTGIDANQAVVSASFTDLRDSLPPTSNLLGFGSAQQVAIQRLATTYCGAVVNDAGNCNNFFGSCQINGNAKDQVANVLYDRFIGDNIANQPDRAGVTTEIVRTIDDLNCAGGCNGATARTALQATCTAVLSSGAVTLN